MFHDHIACRLGLFAGRLRTLTKYVTTPQSDEDSTSGIPECVEINRCHLARLLVLLEAKGERQDDPAQQCADLHQG